MAKMKEFVIDGETYVPKTSVVKKAPSGERLMIVCTDNRGLMFIGKVNLDEKKEFLVIRDARCIICWGTDNHVAQLVNGPTSNTKLGVSEDVIIKKDNIVFAYNADEKEWKKYV